MTLVFDLDPRARWHDGAPVTARDVVFTFARARDPAVAPELAELLRRIAVGDGGRRPPRRLPLHPPVRRAALRRGVPRGAAAGPPARPASRPTALARSRRSSQAPVGNGPYRWVRRVPGSSSSSRPIRALLPRRAGDPTGSSSGSPRDPDARLNLLLGGEADAMDNIPPPRSTARASRPTGTSALVPVPSSHDRLPALQPARPARPATGPIPILATSTSAGRSAWRSTAGAWCAPRSATYGEVPVGPASPILWIRHGAPRAARPERRGGARGCSRRAAGPTTMATACSTGTACRSRSR